MKAFRTLETRGRKEVGGSDSFSGRRKLFWGNDDHLKSRAALSFQLKLLLPFEAVLSGHYVGITGAFPLMRLSSRRWGGFRNHPNAQLSLSHQWKKTAIYGPYPSITRLHKKPSYIDGLRLHSVLNGQKVNQ